jgi:hypothetical protein
VLFYKLIFAWRGMAGNKPLDKLFIRSIRGIRCKNQDAGMQTIRLAGYLLLLETPLRRGKPGGSSPGNFSASIPV